MSLYHSSKYKLKNIQRTIESLLDGDFPLSAGARALLKLQDIFSAFDTNLDRANRLDDAENLRQVAQNLNVKIYQALPILGFIIRSTNVRNAFEMVEPLHALAKATLQGTPQLIVSSEWDYVPFAYPQSLDNLKSFILIGLPASEAASALLMPLAGHELGHAVWRNRGIGTGKQEFLQSRCQAHYSEHMTEFRKIFSDYDPKDLVGRNILPDAVTESSNFAGFQAEELFSDLFAYACFGASYIRAFAYILAPGEGTCDAKYPMHSTRVALMKKVAADEGEQLPDFADLGFRVDSRRGDARHQFIVKMAEASVADLADELWKIVLEIIKLAALKRPQTGQAQLHLRNLQMGIPSPTVECVGDIINAGWQRYDEIVDEDTKATQSAKKEKDEAAIKRTTDKLSDLNEVLLKTVEVFEFRRRVQ